MNEFGVIIGQFQPFTNTHLATVQSALSRVKTLVVVVGGHCQPRTTLSPWSAPERQAMIEECLTKDEKSRVQFVFVKDYPYSENLWIAAIQQQVDDITDGHKDTVIVGHKTRRTSYLEQFPQWELIETGDLTCSALSAHIREMYFTMNLLDIKRHVPERVFEILKYDMQEGVTPRHLFMHLKDEFEHITEYAAQWANSPFAPQFITCDAVVIKSGHLLVTRRRGQPGRGLIALPGGFVNTDEFIIDACLRETKEETAIKVPKEDLLNALRDQRVFDAPKRSLRGRTVTHAFCFNLGQGPLPKVKGEDDADKAWWMSLRDVFASEEQFFEDHFHIVTHFINKF